MPRHASPTTRAWHPAPLSAATPASPVWQPRHASAGADPFHLSGARVPHIIGGCRMLKSFKLQSMVFIPLAGTAVQFGHTPPLAPCRRACALVQSLAQQIGKEMVITVPTPLVVQGDDEQVGMFEIF